jgi:hypothetical protein
MRFNLRVRNLTVDFYVSPVLEVGATPEDGEWAAEFLRLDNRRLASGLDKWEDSRAKPPLNPSIDDWADVCLLPHQEGSRHSSQRRIPHVLQSSVRRPDKR